MLILGQVSVWMLEFEKYASFWRWKRLSTIKFYVFWMSTNVFTWSLTLINKMIIM